MPDFTARITTPSATLAFTDSASPSRLNPAPGHPPRHVLVDTSDATLVAKATVGGVEGPTDFALGGRPFQWWWVQYPGWPGPPPKSLPAITHPVGYSSIAELGPPSPFADVGGVWVGHWILMCWREGGGGVMLPFNVES